MEPGDGKGGCSLKRDTRKTQRGSDTRGSDSEESFRPERSNSTEAMITLSRSKKSERQKERGTNRHKREERRECATHTVRKQLN